MPRERLYASNAERQAAYRARLTQRQAAASDRRLAAKVAELDKQLAAAIARAETAEKRAVTAEGQLRGLKLSVAALQHRLDHPDPDASQLKPAAGPNRAARRAAERDTRRPRH